MLGKLGRMEETSSLSGLITPVCTQSNRPILSRVSRTLYLTPHDVI